MRLSACQKGALVGAANVLAVAICIALAIAHGPRGVGDPEELGYLAPLFPRDAFALVLVLGLAPGILAGWLLGRLVDGVRAPAFTRTLALAVPSLLTVAVLGVLSAQPQLIVPALLPTGVAVLALERWTRSG